MDHMVLFLSAGIVLTVVIVTARDSCPKVCEWLNWSEWSSCSRTCGGWGYQSRYRGLCCKEDWIDAGTCFHECNMYDYYEWRTCGEICFNSGTIKESGYGCDCLERSYGHCCEEILPGCSPFPTDVIFLLDSSVSQTEEQFAKQLDFVKMFVKHVNISFEEFQIAVITFSTEARLEIDFNSNYDKESLLNMIGKITFRPGATFTNKALQLAMAMTRDSESREGMVSLTYVFVLTDGMSNKRSETKIEASSLKMYGIKIIAIGIGKEVSHQELVDIASPGDSYSPSYVFSVGDFNALDTLLKQLVQITCDDCSAISRLSDIIFLLDEGNSMSVEEFELSIDIMTSIIQSTEDIGKTDGPAFGLVRLDQSLTTVENISDNLTQNSVTIKLQALYWLTNMLCNKKEECEGTNITSAIKQVVNNYFTEQRRRNSRRFLIVLSNGWFENSNLIKDEISEILIASDVKLFVIGPGTAINMNGLLSLARDADHVFVCLDKYDITKLNVMQSEFSYNNCTKH